MTTQSGRRKRGVDHLCHGGRLTVGDGDRHDRARIADLTTAFRIKRGRIQVHLVDRRAIFVIERPEHGEYRGIRGIVVVPDEVRGAVGIDQGLVRGHALWIGSVALARTLGSLTLLGHLALEPLGIDAHATLGGDFLGELERESVGVVQSKRRRARDR